LKAVGFWQELDHPTEGRLRMTRFPMTFSETPADVRRPQPRLGEHTAEVLREAGYSAEQIAAMCASGAARQAS
jgi:crotonobetainyl-CoA:carnitine CoA-transferase CaiB-like acyl-CoA transferase